MDRRVTQQVSALNRLLLSWGLFLATGMIGTAIAGSVTEKDWKVVIDADGTALAFTSNGSGSSFGIYCANANSCFAYLDSSTGCDDSSTYPVLVNSDSGAGSFEATCADLGSSASKNHAVIVFNDFSAIIKTVLKDHAIGFAIPLASGQFKVTRFSLEGSNETIQAMNKAVSSSTRPAAALDSVL
jgi:hypothetical protein